ncbi:hypothetical protein Q3G72_029993 [Acer saccharum]|nr:hypothetical protein Q3G72_029993 [Acer saccharum]
MPWLGEMDHSLVIGINVDWLLCGTRGILRVVHLQNVVDLRVIYSMADEYVPEYVDKKASVDRVMGGAEKVEIEHGNHSLSNRVGEAIQAIMNFVKREGPSGWDDPWT